MEKFGIEWDLLIRVPPDLTLSAFAASSSFKIIGTFTGQIYICSDEKLLYVQTYAAHAITTIERIDHNLFIVGNEAGSIFVLKVKTSELEKYQEFDIKEKVTHICPSSPYIFVSGHSGTVYKIHVETHELSVFTKIDMADAVQIVQLSPFGEGLILSTYKKSLIIFDDRKIQIGTKERSGTFGACAFSDHIYAARTNGYLWKVDPETGKVLSTLQFQSAEKISLGVLIPWENGIISYAGKDAEINWINPTNRQLVSNERMSQGTLVSVNQDMVYSITPTVGIYESKFLNIVGYFNKLIGSGELETAVSLVVTYQELQDLKLLEGLCESVFLPEGVVVAEPLLGAFQDVIFKLEERYSKAQMIFEEAQVDNYLDSQLERKKFDLQQIALQQEEQRKILAAQKKENRIIVRWVKIFCRRATKRTYEELLHCSLTQELFFRTLPLSATSERLRRIMFVKLERQNKF